MRTRSGAEYDHSIARARTLHGLRCSQAILMYFILLVWLAAGFADYLCHRASPIETSGWKESLLHLLPFSEMAIQTLAAIFLQINALVIATMIVCLVTHEATAIWDVSYAYQGERCSAFGQKGLPGVSRARHAMPRAIHQCSIGSFPVYKVLEPVGQ
jgi:hypothetical protein